MLLGADFRPRGKEEVESMYNPRFEKEAFKKEVKQNVKHLFRKEIEEVSQQELYQAVSYAVKEGNPFWFLLAVLLHGAIDSMIGLLPYYFGVEVWGLELVFTLFTALLAGGVFLLKRRFDAEVKCPQKVRQK